MRLTKDEEAAVTAARATPLERDYVYLCMGPHCWGRGVTPAEAIANAKKNRVRSYEGKAGWRFLLFAVRVDVRVDDMGNFTWKLTDAELAAGGQSINPYREVYRTPTIADKAAS